MYAIRSYYEIDGMFANDVACPDSLKPYLSIGPLRITSYNVCYTKLLRNFARGAALAAAWVVKQPHGLYTMFDVLGLQDL